MDGNGIDRRVDAKDARPPGRWPEVIEQGSDRRGLARAVGPEKAERFAFLDIEVDVEDPAVGAV